MSTSSITDALQELDRLIQQQQWLTARDAAEDLVAQVPTTPGVIERAMLVVSAGGLRRSLLCFWMHAISTSCGLWAATF